MRIHLFGTAARDEWDELWSAEAALQRVRKRSFRTPKFALRVVGTPTTETEWESMTFALTVGIRYPTFSGIIRQVIVWQHSR